MYVILYVYYKLSLIKFVISIINSIIFIIIIIIIIITTTTITITITTTTTNIIIIITIIIINIINFILIIAILLPASSRNPNEYLKIIYPSFIDYQSIVTIIIFILYGYCIACVYNFNPKNEKSLFMFCFNLVNIS